MKTVIILIIILSTLAIGAALYTRNNLKSSETLFISPVTIECVTSKPTRCLQVKYRPDEAFQPLYEPITGFEFIPGYQYQLLVSTQELDNSPRDSSSSAYTLQEVQAKTQANFIMITNPEDFAPVNSNSQLTVNGTGRGLFEGNVVIELLDPATLAVLSQAITTMPTNNPEDEGRWTGKLNLPSTQLNTLTLRASSPSPQDGNLTISYSLPLTLTTSNPTASSLESNNWQLITMITDQETINPPASTITAQFDGAKISGNSGCNSYFGAYTVTENTIFISQIGSTLRACIPDSLMDLEQAYVNLLPQSQTFSLNNDTLIFYNDAQAPILTFQALPQITIENTPWQAQGINNGQDCVESTATTAQSTALFEAGTISGNAGCNRYSGTYQLAEENLTIGPLISTKMYCADLMDQEQQFLAALEQTNRYELNNNMLTLRRDASTMVNFVMTQ